jgi:TP901 family phage tail tape measure protein
MADVFDIKTAGALSNKMDAVSKSATTLKKSVIETGHGIGFASNQWQRGTITLDNFGQAFSTATRKVLVWQTAIFAIYGVMRKFGEIVEVWRDLEVTLARIGITVGAMGAGLTTYFTQAADIAVEFGMQIEKVLRGMDLSLRATASLKEGAERTTVAMSLLRNASVLANIAGMDYAQSIDILVGSLRQTGMGLHQGEELLDKWVAVAKNAAVSVNELSQGFAVMADAARAAGLSVDQINGLIAALSETVTLGPVMIGNAIRALMSTLYNPGSIALLQKYGVAVKNSAGESRSFFDVMTQLSAMKVSGALDESQWLDIARAAGAGQRRYAQFLALLNNFNTAMAVANVSSFAEQGTAMEANQRIVETLTNAFDQFTAAQRKFFMSLGTNLGIIEGLSGALVKLTGVFDALTRAPNALMQLGKAIAFVTGALVAFKLAMLGMRWSGIPERISGGISSLTAPIKSSAGMMLPLPVSTGMRGASEQMMRYGILPFRGGGAPLPSTAILERQAAQQAIFTGQTVPRSFLPGVGRQGLAFGQMGKMPMFGEEDVGRFARTGAIAPVWQKSLEPMKRYQDEVKKMNTLFGTTARQNIVKYGELQRKTAANQVAFEQDRLRRAGIFGRARMRVEGALEGRREWWGGVGAKAETGIRRAGAWARRPRGMGGFMMPAMITGIGAYAITGDIATSAGAGIASGIGMALAGPVGMAAGGFIGSVIGSVVSNAFKTDADRINET